MAGVREKQVWIFVYCVLIVASMVAIGFSIWLHFSDSATLCQKVLQKPLMIVGVVLLVSSILELVVMICRVTFIIWICSILLSLIMLGFLCSLLFGVLVTNRNVSRALFGRDGNYSHYLLKKYVLNTEIWGQIKSCLVDFKFCQNSNEIIDFYIYIFPNIQSVCCKPPTYCGLEFHNATYWTMPKAGPAVADNDCKIWSNVQTELCFDCQSCTKPFLNHLQQDWKIYSSFFFVLLPVLVCYIGWSVLREKRSNRCQTHKDSA